MGRAFRELVGVEWPVIQAPMAGCSGPELAIAVAKAGGLGSLPTAMLGPEQIRAAVATIRAQTAAPLNLNFFCHAAPEIDLEREAAWSRTLAPFYRECELEPPPASAADGRMSFDATACEIVEALRPEVVSFHFGLPAPALLERVKASGARILSSATTVEEAVWLAARGCDAVIAQGVEAGGHRGMFLTADLATQTGTLALVPQIVDAVSVPVIAAGGIADRRGVAAAFALGASAVQVGTAYLLTRECPTSAVHRRALAAAGEGQTVLTNIFTGRPARSIVNRFIRELGPVRDDVPAFPRAAGAIGPLRAHAEARGLADFSPLWSGAAGPLARETDAGTLTRELGAATRR